MHHVALALGLMSPALLKPEGAPDDTDSDDIQELMRVYRKHHYEGNYRDAISVAEHACAVLERLPEGPEQQDGLSECLNDLGVFYDDQGLLELAESTKKRALAIREKFLGPDHLYVAISSNNLAVLYERQGRYREARTLYERALSIREKSLGTYSPQVALSLNNLAQIHLHQGRYEQAENLYERGIAICEEIDCSSYLPPGIIESNLGVLFWLQGNYERAIIAMRRGLSKRRERLGARHPAVAESLNNLALVHTSEGRLDEAHACLESALSILEERLGPDHPSITGTVSNLTKVYTRRGDYETARPLLERVLASDEQLLGSNHPHIALDLNNLAWVLHRAQSYHGAESMYERAISIAQKSLGHKHPTVANSMMNLAYVYLDQKKLAIGLETLARALDIAESNLSRELTIAPESRKLAFSATFLASTNATLSTHLRANPRNHRAAKLALTTILRRKGRVQDLVGTSYGSLRRALAPEDRHLLEDLSNSRARLSALANSGLPVAELSPRLKELRGEQDRIWRALADSGAVADATASPLTISDVQHALPPGGVLVEFVRYVPRHDSQGRLLVENLMPRYAAYLVFSDHYDWVELGPAERVDELAFAFREDLLERQEIDPALHDAIMGPLVERLRGTHRLILAPDGALNLVPFGALTDGREYLIERYQLHYVSTGRDLIQMQSPGSNTGRIVVVANPTGADLPGADREASLLQEIFPQAHVLSHGEATETKVRQQERPWVLHIATHGFFGNKAAGHDLHSVMPERLRAGPLDASPPIHHLVDNPMIYTGLTLVGRTRVAPDLDPDLDGGGFVDDGRLTAYEISDWDLRGTELVVLSACETGLGEVQAGEGVFGLRRAFAMAGVQTQVMSLWKVSDSATAELMPSYYRRLLAGKGRSEAMQEVQLAMLRSEKYRHPGNWASFIVVGDWGPLTWSKPVGPPPAERGPSCQRAGVAGHTPSPSLLVLILFGLFARRRPGSAGSSRRSGMVGWVDRRRTGQGCAQGGHSRPTARGRLGTGNGQ